MKTDIAKVAHTPTPWNLSEIDDCYRYISGPRWARLARVVVLVVGEEGEDTSEDSARGEANAQFIVKCVNEHELLNAIAEAADEFWNTAGDVPMGCKAYADSWVRLQSSLEKLTTHRKAARE